MEQNTPGTGGVNPRDVPPVTPEPVAVQEIAPGIGGVSPRDVPATPPMPVGAAAFNLPPVAAAGVSLAKFVLWIVVLSICVLIGYLLWMDWLVGMNIATAYTQARHPSRVGAEFSMLDRLSRFSTDLQALRKNPSKTMPPDAIDNAQKIVGILTTLPSITVTQKTQLTACVPPLPSEDLARQETLDRCLGLLEGLQTAALDAASVMNAPLAGEAASKLNEQRQTFHAFWIQAAQLILLNLLLPLLTALFGYVFGTQQAQRSNAQ